MPEILAFRQVAVKDGDGIGVREEVLGPAALVASVSCIQSEFGVEVVPLKHTRHDCGPNRSTHAMASRGKGKMTLKCLSLISE